MRRAKARRARMMWATARRTLSLLLVALLPATAAAGPTLDTTSSAVALPRAGSGEGGLAARYGALERALHARGGLRTDARAAGVAWGIDALARNFLTIAMFSEHGHGGGLSGSTAKGVLRRWEKPVRMATAFGPSAGPELRRTVRSEVAATVATLGAATGHPIRLDVPDPNFLVLVVSQRELRGLDGYLRKFAPDLRRTSRRAITHLPAGVLCMVLARSHADPARGYRGAIAVIRAEHSPLMRRSCIQEELAQAMGLPNDSAAARPSIFNDDEEFAVLTDHDRALLSMLYDQRLRPGMTLEEVRPLLPAIAAGAAAR